MSIGLNVQKRREALGLTQKQLGEKIGIDRTLVNKYEAGYRVPSVQILVGLAKELDCSLDWLVFGDEDGEKAEKL